MKKQKTGKTPRQLGNTAQAEAQPLPPLEELGAEMRAAVEEARERVKAEYYTPLAEQALKMAEDQGELDESVQAEIESLQRTARGLREAQQEISDLCDELGARLRDTKTSRDRKWYALNPPANGAIDLVEYQRGHFARGCSLYKLLLVCFVGSFAGVVLEMLWCLITTGHIESRAGLVYGPFNLLYGAGAMLLTATLFKYRNRGYFWSFLGGFVVGSVLEYACSWGQEVLIGSRSWDYSHMPLNLNGRICLTYSMFWGILGVLWIKDLYPRMAKYILKIPNKIGKPLTWGLTVFLVLDGVVSCIAVARWAARGQGLPPSNAFWAFIDSRFTDERMRLIFANMTFGNT